MAQWLRHHLPMQEACVQSLLIELRPHMLGGVAFKKKEKSFFLKKGTSELDTLQSCASVKYEPKSSGLA